MGRLLVLGGTVIDPAANVYRRMNVIVERGTIAAILPLGARIAPEKGTDRVLDAAGTWVVPGFIDLHVHLRDPGPGDAETLSSGTRAAAAGGFGTIVCMPNTNPILDTPAVVAELAGRIRKSKVRVLPAAAISPGLLGKRLTDFAALLESGAFCFSDDGVGTARLALLKRALRQTKRSGRPLLLHCEDPALSRGGVLHGGPRARQLGLPGISASSEVEAVRRVISAAEEVCGPVHIQHVSCAASLELIRRAKRRKIPVTCEVTPHHLHLSVDHLVCRAAGDGPDPDLKMNPPLRSEADRRALLSGLADGTVDAIATDHAPHSAARKGQGFLLAPFGILGLATALPLTLQLVRSGVISLTRAIWLLTRGPATVLGLDAGTLRVGAPADITVVDPDRAYRLEARGLKSIAKNTPFLGWDLVGSAKWTLVAGRIVHSLKTPSR